MTPMGNDLYYFLADYDTRRPKTLEEVHARREKEQIYFTVDEVPFWKDSDYIMNGRHLRLYLYNRKENRCIPISDPDYEVEHVAVRDDEILYSVMAYQNGIRSMDAAVRLYNVKTGEDKEIMPVGKLMLRNYNQTFCEFWGNKILIVGTDRKIYGAMESPKFYLLDRETGEVSLFCDYPYGINYRSVGNDSKLGKGRGWKIQNGKAYFLSTVGYRTYIRSLDDKGNISDYLTPPGCTDSFDIVGDRLVYCGFFGNKLAEIYENGMQLTHFNDDFLSSHEAVTPEYHSFTASDGYEIDGWIMKPTGYQPGKKYPAILSIHGGPRSLFGDIYFHEHQVWAQAGYFVLYCNPRGSEGKGDDFAHVWGRMGTVDYQNLMDFLDECLKAYPDIDEKRLGVTGGSYGGYMTNWIIGHTNRFKCACTQRSIANWITSEYVSNQGYYWTINNLWTQTLDDIHALWDQSPLKYGKSFKTPTLIIHSNHDFGCTLDEGMQMYHALKRAGTETKMCIFRGEGHELSRSGRPKPRLARFEEILRWMDEHLK